MSNSSKKPGAAATIYLAVVFVILYAPILYLAYYSFNSGGSMHNFEGFTLEWYGEVFQDTRLVIILLNTLAIALFSAAISTMIGVAGAIAIATRGVGLLGGLALLTSRTTTADPTTAGDAVTTSTDREVQAVAWRGATLPASDADGPRDLTDTHAAGFSRTPLGAALAAVQILPASPSHS